MLALTATQPKMDMLDPIISGCWVVWNNWLWWVWEFKLGWREWVPCYTHLSFTLRNQFENSMVWWQMSWLKLCTSTCWRSCMAYGFTSLELPWRIPQRLLRDQWPTQFDPPPSQPGTMIQSLDIEARMHCFHGPGVCAFGCHVGSLFSLWWCWVHIAVPRHPFGWVVHCYWSSLASFMAGWVAATRPRFTKCVWG